MMDKEKLRKADVFSGSVICLFGVWVIGQGLKMPMKDSWGGVQNVWFVSPALFPLLVGAMILLLGGLLIVTALKSVGLSGVAAAAGWLASPGLPRFLVKDETVRFYGVVAVFACFVFLNIPRIDFFLCSTLFLLVFISMFHFDDDRLLKKALVFYLSGTGCCIAFFALGLPAALAPVLPFPNDWLTIGFIAAYAGYAWALVRRDPVRRRKYRTCLILAGATPFLVCPVFKYILLVPMPTEGLVVAVLDAVWYADFF